MGDSSSSTGVEVVEIDITKLREGLRAYLEQVAYGATEIMIQRYGVPLVVIVNPARWRRAQQEASGH